MACPKCKSKDVKAGEKGLIQDEYVCNKCGHEYTTASVKAKATASVVMSGLAAVFAGG